MITPLIFGVLCVIDFAFILFALLDNENRVYGDIVASGLSVILSFMLSNYIISGLIIASESTPIMDGSIGYFFVLIGVVMAIVTIWKIVDVIYGSNDANDY
jgi:hypothetical protein